MSSVSQRSLRVFMFSLFMAMFALSGCQTAPQKGLSPAQIAVLKQQGFELTDEGWEFGLSGKVLFGSDVDSLNAQSSAIVQRIGKALQAVGWLDGMMMVVLDGVIHHFFNRMGVERAGRHDDQTECVTDQMDQRLVFQQFGIFAKNG